MKRITALMTAAAFVLPLLLGGIKAAAAENSEYAITEYTVSINVREDNTFYIFEYITADFYVPKHGIIRVIPTKNTVARLDGSSSTSRAGISNINVSARSSKITSSQRSVSAEKGAKAIKIGNPQVLVTGPVEYTISYLYNIGPDRGKGYDEFYFNIIGTEWDTSISNVGFSIEMPKAFDETKLGFSSGRLGSLDNSKVIYEVEGNTIKGIYNGTLAPGEALTVRLELPEGYFVGARSVTDTATNLSFLVPIACFLITLVLWAVFGKSDQAIEPVEFYPPKGVNSARAGFLYRGYSLPKDVVSLLIYLADKGYIRIEDLGQNVLDKKKTNFRIVRVKNYDGDDELEEAFFNGLFTPGEAGEEDAVKKMMRTMGDDSLFSLSRKNTLTDEETRMAARALTPVKIQKNNNRAKGITLAEIEKYSQPGSVPLYRDEVYESDLKNSFFRTTTGITDNLNSKESKREIFERYSINKGWLIALLMIATLVAITVKPAADLGGNSTGLIFWAVLVPGLVLVSLYTLLFGRISGPLGPRPNKIAPGIAGLLVEILVPIFRILPSFAGIIAIYRVLSYEPMYMFAYIIGVVCFLAMMFIMSHMARRTSYGYVMLGKLGGFRNFLEAAEKPQLEALVEENPQYFYSILPYTYALDISDKWIRKFDFIAVPPPEWYSGRGMGTDGYFSTVRFGEFMDSTMSSATAAMVSQPISFGEGSGGGGGTGGGFSGGGFGGGGGRSW